MVLLSNLLTKFERMRRAAFRNHGNRPASRNQGASRYRITPYTTAVLLSSEIVPTLRHIPPSKPPIYGDSCDTATGIRTPVSGLRIRRPSPLDDSGEERAF